LEYQYSEVVKTFAEVAIPIIALGLVGATIVCIVVVKVLLKLEDHLEKKREES